jgi:hypothetical protein
VSPSIVDRAMTSYRLLNIRNSSYLSSVLKHVVHFTLAQRLAIIMVGVGVVVVVVVMFVGMFIVVVVVAVVFETISKLSR